MQEKDIQTIFGKWLRDNWRSSCAFELKLCKTKSIPFSAVKDHQIVALLDVKHNSLYHKITDQPIFGNQKTRFNQPKPFDCFILKGNAYVAVCFYVPRKQKDIVLVDVDDWEKEKKQSLRKSLTFERASKIGTVIDISESSGGS